MKKLISIVLAVSFALSVHAQKKDYGHVSASLESTSHFYVKDQANMFDPSGLEQFKDGSKGIFASNDYLKADYYKGRFSAGMQVEGYFPTTVGYPIAMQKMSVSNLYVAWRDDSYSVTAGTFYEQLGSGLLFRSWEDRTLGLNNALLGARATYNFKEYLAVRAFWGIPRLDKITSQYFWTGYKKNTPFFGLGLSKVNVAAADVSLSLSECFGWNALSLSLEGSVLNKHDSAPFRMMPENNLAWSGRLNLESSGFYFRGEYVDAGQQCTFAQNEPFDADAQLIELGYNSKGLGVSVTGRRLYRMTQQIATCSLDYDSSVNVMSYCPAMCTQYTYMLTTLHQYQPETGTNLLKAGEIGGQVDAFYNFRRGTKIGGKRGMKVHANFSAYSSLDRDGGVKDGELEFWDFSIDVERQWTKKFKTTLMYSVNEFKDMDADYLGNYVPVGVSHVVVADLLYKWTPRLSTRMELQYLFTDGYQGDWMAALLEVSLAPRWSVFASDMYNHGVSGLHYYNAGVGFTISNLRISAGYGRYRAGFICSGGVCRKIPAYTGANLTLTASF